MPHINLHVSGGDTSPCVSQSKYHNSRGCQLPQHVCVIASSSDHYRTTLGQPDRLVIFQVSDTHICLLLSLLGCFTK
jgi:hypothetical protein